MAQVLRYTATPSGYVIATMQAQVDGLVARMAAGLPILAADVVALVSIYNNFVAHYHTTTDLRGVDTYGNKATYGSGTYVTSTSTTPTGFIAGTAPGTIVVDGIVSAADINAVIAYINAMRTHTHDINDITS